MEERIVENTVKRYAITTASLYAVLLTLFGISLLFTDALAIDAVAIIVIITPSAIALISSKIAKRDSQIESDDKVSGKIMKVNLLTHGLVALGFAVADVIVEGDLSFAITIVLMLAVPPFLISSRMFKTEKNETPFVEDTRNNENKSMLDLEMVEQFRRELEKYERLMSPTRICSLYGLVMISVILLLITVVPLFNIPVLLGLIMVIAPLVAVILSCFLLKSAKIRKGDKLVKFITGLNVSIYLMAVFLTDVTSIFIWLFTAFTFVPVFIISFSFFQKIENNAILFTDASGRVFDFNEINIGGKLTDDSFSEFLLRLGLGNIDYFFAIGLDEGIDRPRAKPTKRYMVAFDEDQVYMFEMLRNKVQNHYVIPGQLVSIIRKLAMENKGRLEIVFGVQSLVTFGEVSLEVPFGVKGFTFQKEMLNRFVEIKN